jgi:hypothetical protein
VVPAAWKLEAQAGDFKRNYAEILPRK